MNLNQTASLGLKIKIWSYFFFTQTLRFNFRRLTLFLLLIKQILSHFFFFFGRIILSHYNFYKACNSLLAPYLNLILSEWPSGSMIITVMFYIMNLTRKYLQEWVIFIGLYFQKKKRIFAWSFQLESKSKPLEIHMNLSTCSIRRSTGEMGAAYQFFTGINLFLQT